MRNGAENPRLSRASAALAVAGVFATGAASAAEAPQHDDVADATPARVDTRPAPSATDALQQHLTVEQWQALRAQLGVTARDLRGKSAEEAIANADSRSPLAGAFTRLAFGEGMGGGGMAGNVMVAGAKGNIMSTSGDIGIGNAPEQIAALKRNDARYQLLNQMPPEIRASHEAYEALGAAGRTAVNEVAAHVFESHRVNLMRGISFDEAAYLAEVKKEAYQVYAKNGGVLSESEFDAYLDRAHVTIIVPMLFDLNGQPSNTGFDAKKMLTFQYGDGSVLGNQTPLPPSDAIAYSTERIHLDNISDEDYARLYPNEKNGATVAWEQTGLGDATVLDAFELSLFNSTANLDAMKNMLASMRRLGLDTELTEGLIRDAEERSGQAGNERTNIFATPGIKLRVVGVKSNKAVSDGSGNPAATDQTTTIDTAGNNGNGAGGE